MTISYSIDRTNNIIYETAEGEITLKDFIKFRKKLLSENLQENIRFLADYRKAKVELSFEEMMMVKESTFRVIRKTGTAALAIVVPDNLGTGMANMYRHISEESNFSVELFKNYDEAKQWLLDRQASFIRKENQI